MEVVLLWLDDLDDALFTVALAWERLRRAVLKVGLVAALGVAAADFSSLAAQWAPMLAYVAAASVGSWLFGAAFRAFYYRHSGSLSAAP
jgi:hypothetical protein